MWVFILEKIYGCEIIISGDVLPPPERALIISNHPSEADWLYWPSIAVRNGILDRMRFITKDVRYLQTNNNILIVVSKSALHRLGYRFL
jgi:hypothetical protein